MGVARVDSRGVIRGWVQRKRRNGTIVCFSLTRYPGEADYQSLLHRMGNPRPGVEVPILAE